MPYATFLNGDDFRADYNPLRSEVFFVNKRTGKSALLKDKDCYKFHSALATAWDLFGMRADENDVLRWLWVNAGFHRYS